VTSSHDGPMLAAFWSAEREAFEADVLEAIGAERLGTASPASATITLADLEALAAPRPYVRPMYVVHPRHLPVLHEWMREHAPPRRFDWLPGD